MEQKSGGQFVQDMLISGDDGGNIIFEAVVFLEQAYIKRKARVKALPGINRFLMEIKAFDMEKDSVQAVVSGHGEILSVQYKETYVKDAPQQDLQNLESKKNELKKQKNVLIQEQEIRKKQTGFLDSISAFSEAEIPKQIKTQFPDIKSLESILEFLGKNYENLGRQSHELENGINDIDKDIDLIETQLKQFKKSGQTVQKFIEVLFNSSEENDIGIEISYSAANASWEPVYKIDVLPDLSDAVITMFAKIEQNTGENWENTSLSISNAVPVKTTALPDLKTWYISQWSSEPVSDDAMLGAAMRTPVEDKDLIDETLFFDMDEPREEAEFVHAEGINLPISFEYRLPQQVNLDSGQGETLVPIFTKKTDCEFFIYAIPQKDPLAYLVCQINADKEMLAGRLNIHFGGRFVGTTLISDKRPGEEMMLSLGADRGVKISREKIRDKKTETFFGMVDRLSVARELGYKIIIENLKDEPVRICLLDSIPVSKTDRIQIKGVEIDTKPTEIDYNSHTGVMLWDFMAEAKSTHEINIKFFVKHPKNSPPLGL
ncbi:CHP02231 [Desulfonema limicola]|uniref:CHP02231 n=1 Tax=Desulfonema limicola TaxID=45656 RepID=A0A975GGQ7_9BACT|nr:mucoidy inhibitor MuiA family protein [Desulfonema limicola]QTA80591.1 CHP02231 [Desulfonema limicola]